jgi:hypothetical protein
MQEEPTTQPAVTETPQPQPQQQIQPQTAPTTPLVTNHVGAFALSSLIVGIVATFSSWIPIWGMLVGIAALVLGIVGLKKNQNKGLAITGIITGSLATLLSLLITTFFIFALSSGFSEYGQGYDNGYDQEYDYNNSMRQ